MNSTTDNTSGPSFLVMLAVLAFVGLFGLLIIAVNGSSTTEAQPSPEQITVPVDCAPDPSEKMIVVPSSLHIDGGQSVLEFQADPSIPVSVNCILQPGEKIVIHAFISPAD